MSRQRRAWLADLTPLRISPPFRRLWLGLLISSVGDQMTGVVVAIQVYKISGSSFDVGLVGGFSLIPLVVFGLYGGAIADSIDRRRLMVWTSIGSAACSAVLVLQMLLSLQSLALLYAVVSVQSGMFAVINPSRQASTPRLVGIELLPAATALHQLASNLAQTLGPLLGGLLIAWQGFGSAYAFDLATSAAALYAVLRLPSLPPDGARPGQRPGLRSIVEGLAYLRSRPIVLMTLVIDLVAMIFGMPRALFPAVAHSFYGGGAATVGLLSAAPAIGAIMSATVSGGLGRVRRRGLAVLVAVTVWGSAIAAFGISRTLWLGLVLLVVAGAADMVSAVFRHTILQVETPDALRGRLQGVMVVATASGPHLGDVEAGGVASATNETASIISGGLICLAGVAVITVCMPSFRQHRALQVPSAGPEQTPDASLS